MRTHRSHTKSRNGCTTCKSRRVKCDEKLPICTNCERRDTQCSYQSTLKDNDACGPSPASSGSSSLEDSPTDIVTPETSRQPALPNFFQNLPKTPPPDNSGISHAVLLSEYYQRASNGIGAADRTEERSRMLRVVIPSVASRHACVSEAMLAVGAISLGIAQLRSFLSGQRTPSTMEFDNMSRRYLDQAHRHYGVCIRALRDMIPALGNDNADAIMACSILMVPYELAHSRFDRCRRRLAVSEKIVTHDCSTGHHVADLESTCQSKTQLLDFGWINFVHGIDSLMTTIKDRCPITGSTMLPFFLWVWTKQEGAISHDLPYARLMPTGTDLRDTKSPDPQLFRHHLLPKVLEESQEAFAELRRNLQNLQISDGSLSTTLEELSRLERAVSNFKASVMTPCPRSFFRIFAAWISLMDPAFLALLTKQDTMALAVYSHFLVYMILFEDLWWCGDLGIGTLRTVLPVVWGCVKCGKPADGVSVQQQHLYAWPVRIARLHGGDDMCARLHGIRLARLD